jgi:hypothetical protein
MDLGFKSILSLKSLNFILFLVFGVFNCWLLKFSYYSLYLCSNYVPCICINTMYSITFKCIMCEGLWVGCLKKCHIIMWHFHEYYVNHLKVKQIDWGLFRHKHWKGFSKWLEMDEFHPNTFKIHHRRFSYKEVENPTYI